ncbi:serine/threonine-protein kinase [Nocardia terrae]|uniref:serine/threonine-protein kinase n=1 Tax=Nocardia terrae TaxID=2675851 RepID=UPI001F251B06|nr:serine/threonine-protein kinase [Nocardia terrae]
MPDPRTDRYQRLSASLGSRPDSELLELIETGQPVGVGVGGSSAVLNVDGVPVFAKRIPLTDLELTHGPSTANLFDVPLHCQYGIGGPSFNAWREVAANTIVTGAVLSGETRAFPMLYHWRVLPGRPPIAAEHADVETVVAAQGGSPAIRTRLEALAAAPNSLALFSEYIPHPLAQWLRENPIDKAIAFERQLSEIVTVLQDHRLLHMDAHFENFRSDGDRIYLTDFGLATSPHFDLSPAEHAFVAAHATHDADYTAMRLVNWLVTEVCGIPGPPASGALARNEYIVRCAGGDIPDDVPAPVAAILARHASAAASMNALLWKLFSGEFPAGDIWSGSSIAPSGESWWLSGIGGGVRDRSRG